MLATFGSLGGQPRWSCDGDVDADLDVDLDDLLIVLGRYGEICPES